MSGEQDRLYLGVDAGATRCRARLRDSGGAVLAGAEGPAANAYVHFERAVEVARGVIDQTLRRAGLTSIDTSVVQLGLGVAGVGSAAEAARFAARFAGFGRVEVVNDAVAACVGAHGGHDGGLIVVGTGSAGVARVAGRDSVIGGRGFHLGDDGSAARLGLEAARAAMRAADGLGPESDLTQQIRAHFAGDALAMVHWAASATPRDYGELAPLICAAAANGDPVGVSLVRTAAEAVSALARAVERLGAQRIAMVGGLGEAMRPFLDPALGARLKAPLFDPTDGALALAGGMLPEPRS
ncbi:MAG: hypothetical protein KGM15_01130 [Pseudomonadota bacterium]|nr:hypothetical protein [Pseudomonadota bacterium]